MSTPRNKLEAGMQAAARELGRSLPAKFGHRMGFALFVFDLGDGGNIAYCSNAEREDMIKAVEEWLARQHAGLTTDPPGPRGQG